MILVLECIVTVDIRRRDWCEDYAYREKRN